MIVCKFGGSATTTCQAINNIKTLAENKERKIFVFSAIGKDENNIKLTDLLLKIHKNKKNKQFVDELFLTFENRLQNLISLTNISFSLKKEIQKIKKTYSFNHSKAYLVSRGEYLTAKIMAKFLKMKFVPAEKLIFIKHHSFDIKQTKAHLEKYLKRNEQIVVPGFYGIKKNKLKLLARGGSDISAAVLALAKNANIYENYTDVNGIYEVNPKIAKSKSVEHLDYKTLCFITQHDCFAIQSTCAKLLSNSNITLNVKSIFDLSNNGTTINGKSFCSSTFIATNHLLIFSKIAVYRNNQIVKIIFCLHNKTPKTVAKYKQIYG